MNGKGSKRRPQFVTDEEFNQNWQRAFGIKKDDKARRAALKLADKFGLPRRHLDCVGSNKCKIANETTNV